MAKQPVHCHYSPCIPQGLTRVLALSYRHHTQPNWSVWNFLGEKAPKRTKKTRNQKRNKNAARTDSTGCAGESTTVFVPFFNLVYVFWSFSPHNPPPPSKADFFTAPKNKLHIQPWVFKMTFVSRGRFHHTQKCFIKNKPRPDLPDFSTAHFPSEKKTFQNIFFGKKIIYFFIYFFEKNSSIFIFVKKIFYFCKKNFYFCKKVFFFRKNFFFIFFGEKWWLGKKYMAQWILVGKILGGGHKNFQGSVVKGNDVPTVNWSSPASSSVLGVISRPWAGIWPGTRSWAVGRLWDSASGRDVGTSTHRTHLEKKKEKISNSKIKNSILEKKIKKTMENVACARSKKFSWRILTCVVGGFHFPETFSVIETNLQKKKRKKKSQIYQVKNMKWSGIWSGPGYEVVRLCVRIRSLSGTLMRHRTIAPSHMPQLLTAFPLRLSSVGPQKCDFRKSYSWRGI